MHEACQGAHDLPKLLVDSPRRKETLSHFALPLLEEGKCFRRKMSFQPTERWAAIVSEGCSHLGTRQVPKTRGLQRHQVELTRVHIDGYDVLCAAEQQIESRLSTRRDAHGSFAERERCLKRRIFADLAKKDLVPLA